MSLIVTERPRWWDFDVWHGEDWLDPLPPMTHPITGDPINLTNITLQFYARPTANHATRFIALTTVASAGFFKDADVLGLATIYYPMASVEANIPITTASNPWWCMIRAVYPDVQFGNIPKFVSLGAFRVHPAKIAATV